ncbi:hypothetical protein [Grimontia marina]|uniref:Uncharacterized protein n=1 Tax=Grimontia marina TaxID=646534 RepID=A0A128F0C7_9GAMM|nr:hypothetical protein [Grimontia marina]CZF79721.1 hypothetical protein GMA8713_01102 [Grimontia marina]
MGKQSIVYIGPKAFKRDTVAGTRQVFPRHQPIEVADEVAARLLRFDEVFVEEDELENVLEKQKAEERAKADAEAKDAEEAEKRRVALDMTVTANGETVDLAKMTLPKLRTLVESLDGLDVEPKGAQEKTPEFARRIRDAIRERQDTKGE